MNCLFVSLLSLLHSVVCAVELGSGFNTDAVNETSPRIGEQLWRFYGLFQLGNRLACSDGTTSSPNVCQKDCESELQLIFLYASQHISAFCLKQLTLARMLL